MNKTEEIREEVETFMNKGIYHLTDESGIYKEWFYVKEFIEQKLSEQEQQIRAEPIGIEQWTTYGMKYGYHDYWHDFWKDMTRIEIIADLRRDIEGLRRVGRPDDYPFNQALDTVLSIIKK